MGCNVSENTHQILPAFGYAQAEMAQLDFVSVDSDNYGSYSPNVSASPADVRQINPFIDNLRVVCCENRKMLGG